MKIEVSTAFIQNGVRPAIASHTTVKTRTRRNHFKPTQLQMSNEPPLTAFLDKLSNTGLDNTRIQRDSLVIAKYDVPDLGKKSPFSFTPSHRHTSSPHQTNE